MKIEEVAENGNFNRSAHLSALRLPHLTHQRGLTGSRLQKNAKENSEEVKPGHISEEANENGSTKTNELTKRPKKASRPRCPRIRPSRFLPQTAERLSIMQRTYGVTVVPEQVLFRSLRPQVQRETQKVLSQLEKEEKRNPNASFLTDSHDVQTIDVDVPFTWKQKEEKAVESGDSLPANESSVSLPNSGDDSKHSMPFFFATPKKKKFSKTRKKEKKEEAKKEEEVEPVSVQKAPRFRRKRTPKRASKDITEFFLNLTRKPPLKPVADPRFKDQERLVFDYYKKCQNFLLAAPKGGSISKYCSNVNNSEMFRKDNDKESRKNSSREPSSLNENDNTEKNGNKEESAEKSFACQDFLRSQSLNSLEDFDAFVAKTVMERIRKSKRKRARVKTLLRKEYERKHEDASTPSSSDEENTNNSNATSEDLSDSDGEEGNILSSCSNEFSNLSDDPEPMMESIDKFDNFVAKTIKNHINRQTLQRRSKRRQTATKQFNSYEKWLQRRIFGYCPRKKSHQSSNVSNVGKKSFKKNKSTTSKSKNRKKSCISISDSLFSEDSRRGTSKKERPKKDLIDNIVKAMMSLDNELMLLKPKKNNRDGCEMTTTSEAGFNSRGSSIKQTMQRSDSMPLLNEVQEKRALAMHTGIESVLTAPAIYKAYQIASAIPFDLPRSVFNFTDVDKCHKFEKMVRTYTGHDHVLLNSIAAMNEINKRVLNFHKQATDSHKEKLRQTERRRREILIREGIMDRDFDDLEIKRQKQFLRTYYNPKRVARGFTVNPMRNRYDMASKTFKVQDELNVAESFGKLQSKTRRLPEKKKKVLMDSKYSSILQSENSTKKAIVDIRGEKIDDCYVAAASTFDSIFSPQKILGYSSDKREDWFPSLTAASSGNPSSPSSSSPSSSSPPPTSVTKGLKGIFGFFSKGKADEKVQQKKPKKEKEKKTMKIEEEKSRRREKSTTCTTDISNVTSLSTSIGKDGLVHVKVSAGLPPCVKNDEEKQMAFEEEDELETLPTITFSMKASKSDSNSLPESIELSNTGKSVAGLTKIIDEMIVNMDDEHGLRSTKSKASRRSRHVPPSKVREAARIPEKMAPGMTTSARKKMSRTRSMRTGMQITSSQPVAPQPTPAADQHRSKKVAPTIQEPMTSSAQKWKTTSGRSGEKALHQKGSQRTPSKGIGDPSPRQIPTGKSELEREFMNTRLFLEEAPKKKKKSIMKY